MTYYSAHCFHNKQFWGLVVVMVCGCVCFGHHLLLGTEPDREPYSSTTCPGNSPTRQESPSFIIYFYFLNTKTNLLQQPSTTEWCPSPLICPSGRPASKGRMPPTESSAPAGQSCAAPSVPQLSPVGSKSPPSDYSLVLKKNGTIWADRKLCSRRRYLINTCTYCSLLNS